MNKKAASQKIFTNGTFYITPTHKANNLLVEDGKIKAHGINPSDYKNAEIIDLKQAFVYPGFGDSHTHIIETAYMIGINLSGCYDADTLVDSIAEQIKDIPKNQLIIGGGFLLNDYNAWSLEDLAKIDKITPKNPLLLTDKLGHNIIINSKAIDICEITAETPIPMGGKTVIDNGKFTGLLREASMTLAGNKIFPLLANDKIKNDVKATCTKWASMGYTFVSDMMGGPFGRIIKPEICQELEKDGELPIRVNYMFTCFGLSDIENALEYIGKDSDQVRFGGLKIFIDGAFAAGEAWTLWANKQGGHGVNCFATDDTYGKEYNINRMVERANELGLNVHYHIQGDQAVEATLNAIEAAKQKAGKLTSVHTLVHLAFITDEQIKRIKKFDDHVITTVQPAFWEVEGDLSKYYGKRDKKSYPAKRIIEGGISTGMSTDYWVSPLPYCAPSKIMNISILGAGDPTDRQPLTMQDLIQGFSKGSANTTVFKNIGTLDIGYKADMVVYNKDLFSVSAEELDTDNPKVLSTWINGQKVYEA